MRRPHHIQDNKTSDYPQQCIWFDTETDQVPVDDTTVKHVLRMGYACYMRKHRDGKWTDETWLRFTTLDEFWAFVISHTRKKIKLYLFCHNTNFDLPVLDVFHSLPQRGYTLRSAVIDAPPTILRFTKESASIVILDTLNIWRMPLAYLGETIGLAKLEMPDNNDLTAEWEVYAKRDVEIIRTACLKWWEFLQSNDMGSFAPTLAGQSMQLFRHKYMKHKIFIDDNAKALELTRSGYYGGRVECFHIGRYKGSFYSLDINSMYPSVMAMHEYPFRLVSSTKYASLEDIHIWLKRYCITARVILRTSRSFAPYRKDNKLLFPTGTYKAVLNTPELTYAIEHAEILSVEQVAVYEKDYLFREMMLSLTADKAQAKRDGRYVDEHQFKKLINSFYGKWGQSGGKWLEEFTHDDLTCKRWVELDMVTGKTIQHRQFSGLVQRRDEEAETRDSFPAIAAHVTAHARMLLWSLIEQAGIDHTYYCDTDSLLVDTVGRERLSEHLDDYALGKLKLQGEYDDIEIWGAKDYRFGSKEKHKGVRKKAEWLNTHKVRQEQWSGLRGLIQSGKVDAPLTKTVVKNLKRLYEKGQVDSSGLVLPFEFGLEPEILYRQEPTAEDEPYVPESMS